MVRELPEPHIRLMFGVMLYRSGLISEHGLKCEAVAAFGKVGNEIVRLILNGCRRSRRAERQGVPPLPMRGCRAQPSETCRG